MLQVAGILKVEKEFSSAWRDRRGGTDGVCLGMILKFLLKDTWVVYEFTAKDHSAGDRFMGESPTEAVCRKRMCARQEVANNECI